MWGGGSDLPNFWLSSRPRLLKKMLLDTGLVSLTMLPCLPPPLPVLPRFDSWLLLPRVACGKRGLRPCTRSHLRTRASSSRSRGRREPVGFRAALSSCQRLSEAVHVNTPPPGPDDSNAELFRLGTLGAGSRFLKKLPFNCFSKPWIRSSYRCTLK